MGAGPGPYCGVRQVIKVEYGTTTTDHFCAMKPPDHDGPHQCICGAQFDGPEGAT